MSRTDSLASQAPSTSSWGSPTRRPKSIALAAPVVEAFGAGEQHLADAIQRVGLAAAMAEGLVLHPSTHLVQTTVGHPHDVEGIGHPAGVIEIAGTVRPGSSRPGP